VQRAARTRRALFGGGRDTLLGVVVAVIACALLFGARGLFRQDSWLALVAGREIWNSGVPHHDALTALTLGRDWVDQQWLSQLGIYSLYRLGGLSLVSAVHVALVTGSLAAAIAIGRRRGTSNSTMLLILVVGVVLVLVPSLVVRTQPYAYPLFVATAYLLSSDSRAPSNRVCWTLPLLVLWANVHGSAALGAGMVGLRGLTILYESVRGDRPRADRRLTGALLVVAAPATLLATPYGVSAVGYYRDTLLNPDFNRLVAEWKPVTAVPVAAATYFTLAGLAVWSMGRHPGRLTPWERIVTLVLLAGGILALRNVVWVEFMLLMLPVIALGSGAERTEVRPRVNQALALLASAAVLLALVVNLARSDGKFEKRYPAAVATAVDRTAGRDPAMKVFADVRYADWLLWHIPSLKGRVAFDARFELQPSGALERLARALTATGIDWKQPAQGYRLVVLTPDKVKEAARGFRAEAGRRILYDDSDGLVVLRSPTATG
jgi:hypothetical protein